MVLSARFKSCFVVHLCFDPLLRLSLLFFSVVSLLGEVTFWRQISWSGEKRESKRNTFFSIFWVFRFCYTPVCLSCGCGPVHCFLLEFKVIDAGVVTSCLLVVALHHAKSSGSHKQSRGPAGR